MSVRSRSRYQRVSRGPLMRMSTEESTSRGSSDNPDMAAPRCCKSLRSMLDPHWTVSPGSSAWKARPVISCSFSVGLRSRSRVSNLASSNMYRLRDCRPRECDGPQPPLPAVRRLESSIACWSATLSSVCRREIRGLNSRPRCIPRWVQSKAFMCVEARDSIAPPVYDIAGKHPAHCYGCRGQVGERARLRKHVS
jgi:hypothetical protein